MMSSLLNTKVKAVKLSHRASPSPVYVWRKKNVYHSVFVKEMKRTARHQKWKKVKKENEWNVKKCIYIPPWLAVMPNCMSLHSSDTYNIPQESKKRVARNLIRSGTFFEYAPTEIPIYHSRNKNPWNMNDTVSSQSWGHGNEIINCMDHT